MFAAIEGNRLILGVTSEIFQGMIADPKRARVIEQAINDMHKVKLRIDVRVVDSILAPIDDAPVETAVDDPLVAAGQGAGWRG